MTMLGRCKERSWQPWALADLYDRRVCSYWQQGYGEEVNILRNKQAKQTWSGDEMKKPFIEPKVLQKEVVYNLLRMSKLNKQVIKLLSGVVKKHHKLNKQCELGAMFALHVST